MPSKTRRGRGKPAYSPTEEHAALIRKLAVAGVQQQVIAGIVNLSLPTLKKYYLEILKNSATQANANVAAALYRNATEKNNVAAQIFWMKTRAGWREVETQDQQKPQRRLVYEDWGE